LFLRVSRNLGAGYRVDLYGGGMADGNIEIKTGDGDKVVRDDYAFVPTVALTLSARF
jgi:hypothetical protein